MNERMSSTRNNDSVKCKCKHRVLFSKDDVEMNDDGQRVVYCDRCHREIVLRKK